MSAILDNPLVPVEPEDAAPAGRPLLRLSTAGSVDDGKSTLIGRLLYDSKSVWEDHLEEVTRNRVNRAAHGPDLSLLTDGLRAEREQGITIDVAYRYFSTPRRQFIVADTPGHEQYTRNMATGASTADVAIVLLDARKGVLPQTVRHATIAWLLGVRRLAFAINKMDLVDFSEDVFERIRQESATLLARLPGAHAVFFPISALDGDNVVAPSRKTPWYDGPTLLDWLEGVDAKPEANLPLRLPVQLVIRPHLDFRGYAGQIASGALRPGDRVLVMPAGKAARVKRLVSFDGDLARAYAPMSVTVELDREIDISRGDWITAERDAPQTAARFRTTLVWMNDQPARAGAAYLLQHGTRVTPARVVSVEDRLDVVGCREIAAAELGLNDIGRVEIETAEPIPYDSYRENRATGGFILIDRITNLTVAAGLIEAGLAAGHDGAGLTPAERASLYGHHPALVDLSARPGLAPALEKRLLLRHAHAVVVEDPALPVDFLLRAGLLVIATTPRADATLHVEAGMALASDVVEALRQRGIFETSDFNQGEGI
jgi:sulfate adenylyltransferase large subunit